jgi:LmbE family N-acetylglucosaminyl deacetylase
VNVLAVFAHPDDEVLACGGTLARHADGGDDVAVLFMADGVTSRADSPPAVRARKMEARAASTMLGLAREPLFCDLPDQQLAVNPVGYIADAIRSAVEEHQPEVLYTHWEGDLNDDHGAVVRAVMVATRPGCGAEVWRVVACEVPESTASAFGRDGYRPNLYVDISATLAAKMKALDQYRSERREGFHPRSKESVYTMARARGAAVGLHAAEAHVLLREVHR